MSDEEKKLMNDAETTAPDNMAEAADDDVVPDDSAQDDSDAVGEGTPADDSGKAKADASNDDQQESAIEQAMKDQAREDEKPQSSSFTLRKILGGDWLTADFLRRQIGIILLVTGFIIVYISNRYSCQKDMLEIDRLNAELTDAKYKALSTSSELTEICRQSNVLEMLQTHKDSVLKIANQPPFFIDVPKNHHSATMENQ